MTHFENYLHQYFDFSPEDCKIVAACFKPETLKKGNYFLHSGVASDRLSFIQEGMLRIYVQQPDREVTQWISTSGDFVTDFNAFFYRNPSFRDIQALTDTQLLTIDYETYQALGKSVPAWKEFEKLFIGKCFVFMENRVFDLISLSAEERYKSLFEQKREMFKHVPLQYLASMLGMTPETFSRIRKKQSFLFLDFCQAGIVPFYSSLDKNHSMFIGHFGLSFAAKKAAPKVSLGTLFIATQFVDILWPFLLVFHVEKMAIVPGYTKVNAFEFLYFPYTHSLLMGVVWGALVGGIYWLFKRDTPGALIVGLCVLSHWFFDLVVHTADLPLTPFGDYKVGFGLWNNLAATLIIETAIFLAGTYVYATFTKAKNKIGSWGLWTLVILLLVISLYNTFGPAPLPSTSLITLLISFMTMMGLIIGLAYWSDHNRTTPLS
jgi:CRP-like cAMP-binding protein